MQLMFDTPVSRRTGQVAMTRERGESLFCPSDKIRDTSLTLDKVINLLMYFDVDCLSRSTMCPCTGVINFPKMVMLFGLPCIFELCARRQ